MLGKLVAGCFGSQFIFNRINPGVRLRDRLDLFSLNIVGNRAAEVNHMVLGRDDFNVVSIN
jgi:hypothetical protein